MASLLPLRTSRKNIIILFFTALVCMPVSFSIWFLVSKKIIEHQMEERMEKENLHKATLPLREVIWVKKEKEILLNGRMFDIKRYTIHGQTMTVYGIFDEKEKKLALQFSLFQKHGTGKAVPGGICHLIFTCFFNPPATQFGITRNFEIIDYTIFYVSNPRPAFLAVLSPPPDVIS